MATSHKGKITRSELTAAPGLARIAIEALKGGVGKTELAVQNAAQDTRMGRRVLLLELDPQGSATNRIFGVDPDSVPRTVGTVIHDVVKGSDPRAAAERALLRMDDRRLPLDEAKRDAWGLIDVLPCNLECGGLSLPAEHLRVLDKIVGALMQSGRYYRTWIDFSPSITALSQAGRYAAERFVGITEAAKGSIRGVWQWRDTLARIDPHHRADIYDTARVVINKYAGGEREDQTRARELEDSLGLDTHGGLLLSPHVPRRAVIRQAEGAELPVWAYGTPEAHDVDAKYLSRLHGKITRENR